MEELRSKLIYILKYLGKCCKITNLEWSYEDDKIKIFTSSNPYHVICDCQVYIKIPRKLWFCKKELVFDVDMKGVVYACKKGKWVEYIDVLKIKALAEWESKEAENKKKFEPINDESIFN